MDKQHYVYQHIRPDKNEVFYIGIGSDYPNRYTRAYAFSKNHRNSIWDKIYKKNNNQVIVEILSVHSDLKECFKEEKRLIQIYGRLCHGTGSLANISQGGESAAADSKKIIQYDSEGYFIKVWDNVNLIEHQLGIKSKTVYRCISLNSIVESKYLFKWWSEDYPEKIKFISKTRRKKIVYQYDKDCNLIKIHPSVFTAGTTTSIDPSSIFNAIKGNRSTAGNFIWSYTDICNCVNIPIYHQYTLTNDHIRSYSTLAEITKELNITSCTAIKNCFTGKQKQAYGFKWIKKNPDEAYDLGLSLYRLENHDR
jgi:hypothetical protein